jgi:hypothetical protein
LCWSCRTRRKQDKRKRKIKIVKREEYRGCREITGEGRIKLRRKERVMVEVPKKKKGRKSQKRRGK